MGGKVAKVAIAAGRKGDSCGASRGQSTTATACGERAVIFKRAFIGGGLTRKGGGSASLGRPFGGSRTVGGGPAIITEGVGITIVFTTRSGPLSGRGGSAVCPYARHAPVGRPKAPRETCRGLIRCLSLRLRT